MTILAIRRGLTGGLVAALLLAAVATPAVAQKRGGTLTIVRPTDPISLDPHLETTAPGAWVYYNMLETLVVLDEKMQIQPKLAVSWEVLSPTRVRFKLRPGVKFHDGTPFNAAAVKFTLDRGMRGTPPSRWAGLAGPLVGAEPVDDLTVDVVTREPYGPILRWSSPPWCPPPPSRRWARTSAAPRWGRVRSSSSSGGPTPTSSSSATRTTGGTRRRWTG
jgi:peptide/nickel transport system substrate-binding protein